MKVVTDSPIDLLIAELKALKASAAELEANGVNIEAQITQIRAMLKSGKSTPSRKKAGWAKQMITFIADDFDAPIEDMAAYS